MQRKLLIQLHRKHRQPIEGSLNIDQVNASLSTQENLVWPTEHADLETEIEELTAFWEGYEFEPTQTCCESKYFNMLFFLFRFSLYSMPFFVAVQDMGNLLLGLQADQRTSWAWQTTGGATAFFVSLGLNGKETFKDFDTFIFYIRRWQFPAEQKYNLSTKREIISCLLSAVPIIWSTATDTLNAWYFISHLKAPIPHWQYFAVPLSVPSGGNTLCGSEGLSTLDSFRYMLQPQEVHFCQRTKQLMQRLKETARHPHLKFSQLFDEFIQDKRLFSSHVLSNVVGMPLGMLSCFQDIVNITYVIKQTVLDWAHLEDVEYLWMVSGFSLISGISEYLFHGRYAQLAIKDALYALFTFDLNWKKIIASGGSLALAGFLAYLQVELNILFYNGLLEGYKFKPSDRSHEIFFDLSYAVACQQTILGAANLYPGLYNLLTCTEKIILHLHSKFKRQESSADQSASQSLLENESDIEKAADDEKKARGKIENQYGRFFAPKFPIQEKSKSPSKHRCGCTVS